MRSQALLAIGLTIGFYFLAIGISLSLIGIAYEVVARQQWGLSKIALACLIAAFVILRSILPVRHKFEVPGPRLECSDAPALFELIDDIARRTNQPIPLEVYLIAEMNAWVMQRGAFLGFGGHRVLAIGFPMLQTLSQSQLRSVIAHEFGHFCAADTKLSPIVYRTTQSVVRTLRALHAARSHVHVLFRIYGDFYVKMSSKISRRQELAADALAAGIAGVQPSIQALQTVHRVSLPAVLFWNQEVAPVVNTGSRPRLSEGLSLYLSRPTMQQLMSEQIAASEEPDELDTHPPLSQRIQALEKLNSSGQDINDSPAMSLLKNPEFTEASLLGFMYKVNGQELKPVEWANVASQIYLPLWGSWLVGQLDALETVQVEEIPAAFAPDSMFLRRFADPPGTVPTREERRRKAQVVLTAALAINLVGEGWSLDCGPGVCELKFGERTLNPFEAVAKIASGATKADEWKAWCAASGISGLRLFEAKTTTA